MQSTSYRTSPIPAKILCTCSSIYEFHINIGIIKCLLQLLRCGDLQTTILGHLRILHSNSQLSSNKIVSDLVSNQAIRGDMCSGCLFRTHSFHAVPASSATCTTEDNSNAQAALVGDFDLSFRTCTHNLGPMVEDQHCCDRLHSASAHPSLKTPRCRKVVVHSQLE